uniref:Uncharacterized protein n=1 Tax=Bionectria ochroleuca TaxID=29856 RepID=A0A0B7JWS4_BIOOC
MSPRQRIRQSEGSRLPTPLMETTTAIVVQP